LALAPVGWIWIWIYLAGLGASPGWLVGFGFGFT
jgi:hypothetical protein